MRNPVAVLFCALWILALAMPALAQESRDAAVEAEKERKQTEAALKSMVEYATKVRLTEADVKMVLEHAASFAAAGVENEESEVSKKLDEGYEKTGKYDYAAILEVDAYKAWASEAGVDGKRWLEKWSRLNLLFLSTEMKSAIEQARKSYPEQKKQLEAKREQLGEETYQESKAAMEESMKMLDMYVKVIAGIPAPNQTEKELLEKYGDELRATMGEDEEDEDESGWGDDEEDGDFPEDGEEDMEEE